MSCYYAKQQCLGLLIVKRITKWIRSFLGRDQIDEARCHRKDAQKSVIQSEMLFFNGEQDWFKNYCREQNEGDKECNLDD